jgi:hypothetical protein
MSQSEILKLAAVIYTPYRPFFIVISRSLQVPEVKLKTAVVPEEFIMVVLVLPCPLIIRLLETFICDSVIDPLISIVSPLVEADIAAATVE